MLVEQHPSLPGRDDHPDPVGQHKPSVYYFEDGVVALGILLVGHYRQVAGVADYRVLGATRHLPSGFHEAPLYLLWIHKLIYAPPLLA